MAVRFDADEGYSSSGVAAPPFTMVCWARLTSDRNNFSTIFSSSTGTDGHITLCQTDSDGTTLRVFTNGTSLTGRALTVGQWYRIAISRDTNSCSLYVGTDTGALALDASTATPGDASGATLVRIGRWDIAGEWFDGRVAAFKMYGAVLTAAEIETESWQYQPHRTANLTRWHPLVNAETVDYSGAGRTLTATGTPTTEAGPPIRWGPSRSVLILPSAVSSVAGTIQAAAPLPTASTAGVVRASGSLASSAPLPTAATSGTVLGSGTLAATSPMPTATSTASIRDSGTIATTAPGPTASFAASVTANGSVSAVAPLATAALVGGVGTSSQLAATSPSPVAVFSGAIAATGSLTAALPGPLALLGGGGEASGALAAALELPTGQLFAGVAVGGAFSAASLTPTMHVTGGLSVTAGLLVTLPLPILVLSAQGTDRGALQAGLPMRVSGLVVGSLDAMGGPHGGPPSGMSTLRAGEPTRVVIVHG